MDQEKITEAPVETPEVALLDEIALAKKARLDFAMRDLDEFLERHADVDVEKLMGNTRFLRFCGSRMGHESLATL